MTVESKPRSRRHLTASVSRAYLPRMLKEGQNERVLPGAGGWHPAGVGPERTGVPRSVAQSRCPAAHREP